MATAESASAANADATRVATKPAPTADDAAAAAIVAQNAAHDAAADAIEVDTDAGMAPLEKEPPPAPGPRAARLQALFASSLRHTLAKLSWTNFAACYPTAAARNPAALQTVHNALIARLEELCAAEFAAVLQARDVVRQLNALEDVLDAARQRRAAAATTDQPPPPPPHTRSPETVVAAHLRPLRRAQRERLEQQLRTVQAANAARFAQLQAQQAEAERLVGALEQALADAAAAAGLLDGRDPAAPASGDDNNNTVNDLVTVLARETRAADLDMAEF